jgi:NAD+ synthase (glutamine-hydrolysing)
MFAFVGLGMYNIFRFKIRNIMTKKINYFDYGYVRCSAVSPQVFIANPMKNAKKILELAKQEEKKESLIILFPELSITGYTCEDLFLSDELLQSSNKALAWLITETKNLKSFIIVGHPYQVYDGKMYNCASVLYKGKILGMIPKCYLPSSQEFFEKRYWISGLGVDQEISDFGQSFRLCSNQIFNFNNKVVIGIEICEDLFGIQPRSSILGLQAQVILNPSASDALAGKHQYRKELVNQQSARTHSAYVYVSASPLESTKDMVMSGVALISENGTLIAEGNQFSFDDEVTCVEIDIQKLNNERRKNITFGSTNNTEKIHVVNISDSYNLNELKRNYPKNPFVPTNTETLKERSEEILQIQTTALARKMLSIGTPKLVMGLSGGLDSTLVLLVCIEAMKKLKRPFADITCLSMPCLGTSDRTKDQARRLAQLLQVTFKEIDITKSVESHFEDIDHDKNKADVVFENTQARYRTSMLFNYANKDSSLVPGSSDLSEIWLGFSSYAGDSIAHMNINASIPKTLVQHLIRYYKDYKTNNLALKKALQDVLDTKISPELLPLNRESDPVQSSETIIGPYELHDFFIYSYLRHSFSLDKILMLAKRAFKDDYPEEIIEKWHKVSFDRFRKFQFKRVLSPSSVKVGVGLSPRTDFRCPDDW